MLGGPWLGQASIFLSVLPGVTDTGEFFPHVRCPKLCSLENVALTLLREWEHGCTQEHQRSESRFPLCHSVFPSIV